jgi:hypothetical protein
MSYIGNEPIVSATRTVTEVTATAGQTVFTANGGYTVGFLDVLINGAKLTSTDFTATDGTTVTLTEAAQVNDIVRLEAWGTATVANTYTQAEADNRFVNVTGDTMTGSLEIQSTNSNVLKLHKTGVSALGVSPLMDFQVTQTNSQSALLGRIASEFISGWGGDLSFYTKPANGSPDNSVTERMRIDSSGRVTMPYQPAFVAAKSGNTFVLDGGSVTTVVFDVSRLNRGGHYNTSNGRFTAPVSGVYRFAAVFTARSTSSTTYEIKIYVNGTEAARNFHNGAGYAHFTTAEYICQLSAGDYVNVGGYFPNVTFAGTGDIDTSIGICSAFYGNLIG